VFDVSDLKSFEDIRTWTKQFEDAVEELDYKNCVKVLVGNRSDKIESRKVTKNMILKFCDELNGMPYMECSAGHNSNVLNLIGYCFYEWSNKGNNSIKITVCPYGLHFNFEKFEIDCLRTDTVGYLSSKIASTLNLDEDSFVIETNSCILKAKFSALGNRLGETAYIKRNDNFMKNGKVEMTAEEYKQ
jgi:hypothetical protein